MCIDLKNCYSWKIGFFIVCIHMSCEHFIYRKFKYFPENMYLFISIRSHIYMAFSKSSLRILLSARSSVSRYCRLNIQLSLLYTTAVFKCISVAINTPDLHVWASYCVYGCIVPMYFIDKN